MISAGDFRNGITIEYDNNVYQIIEFQHVPPWPSWGYCPGTIPSPASLSPATPAAARR